MREIKFRAWSLGNRMKGIEPHYIEDFAIDAFYGTPKDIFDGNRSEDGIECIEQYTGLKDKNGIEIYEGDIVNVIGVGIAQVIDSPSGEWMLYYALEPDEASNGFVCVMPENKPSGLWEANTTSHIEVIGNIHENPELLGDKE